MNAVIKADIDRMVADYREGYSLEQPFLPVAGRIRT